MTKFVLYLLLVTVSAIWSVRVGIRRSPPGDILESAPPNLTLHCDLLEADSGPVERVIWYYQGEVLGHIADQEYDPEELEDFLHHELGSWQEGSSEVTSAGEAGGVLVEDDLLGSGDFSDQETDGSGDQSGQLSLRQVTRQASGRYACAVVSGGEEGPRSEELELSVECKSETDNKASHLTLTRNVKQSAGSRQLSPVNDLNDC